VEFDEGGHFAMTAKLAAFFIYSSSFLSDAMARPNSGDCTQNGASGYEARLILVADNF
jgi:hypothetical protein